LTQNLKHFPLTSQTHSFHQKWGNGLQKLYGTFFSHIVFWISGTVEGTYEFSGKLLGLARYDWHDVQDSAAEEDAIVASLQYHFVPNVKLNLEYRTSDVDVGGTSNAAGDEKSLRAYLRFGF
jgi:hypothetical protein|tara:strand:- start:277 stop:642 length:366 start_codon:yes stop_codon:yes gene_type:complete